MSAGGQGTSPRERPVSSGSACVSSMVLEAICVPSYARGGGGRDGPPRMGPSEAISDRGLRLSVLVCEDEQNRRRADTRRLGRPSLGPGVLVARRSHVERSVPFTLCWLSIVLERSRANLAMAIIFTIRYEGHSLGQKETSCGGFKTLLA